jgi:hypothetical protein
MPLPVTEKIEIRLVYSEREQFVIFSLEPDHAFERLSPAEKLAWSPRGATSCFHFSYTRNRYVDDVGSDVEILEKRVGRCEFVPGHGLVLETDSDDVHEVQSVMDDALFAIYRNANVLEHYRTESVH